MAAVNAKKLPAVSCVTPLRRVCDGVHVMDGSFCMLWAMRVPVRMTVLVLPDNELLVYSPLPPDLVDADALKALGTVKYIVAPNHMHKSYAPSFASGKQSEKSLAHWSCYSLSRQWRFVTSRSPLLP
jgi:Domain of unknown function (DUF4336)